MSRPTTRQAAGLRLSMIAVHGNGGGASRFARLPGCMPEDVDFRAITLPGFADVPSDARLQTLGDYARWVHRAVSDVDAPCVVLGGMALAHRWYWS